MLEIQRVEISSFLQRPPLHFHNSIFFLVWLGGTFIWTAKLSLVCLQYFWQSWLLDEIALWVKLPCSCNFFNTAPLVWCGRTLGTICMVKTGYPIPRLSWQIEDLLFSYSSTNIPSLALGGFSSSSTNTSSVTASSHVLTLSSRSISTQNLGAKFSHGIAHKTF